MKRVIFFILLIISTATQAQMVPSSFEQIQYLVTFGPKCSPAWGDDDNSQVFFFLIPYSFTKPVFIRVFDPTTGDNIDQKNGVWDTKTKFTVYGGNGTHSDLDSRKTDPVGNYKSGDLMASKTFDSSKKYDNKWYTFGPFNPLEGEKSEEMKGHIFKVIAEGVEGNQQRSGGR